MPLLSRYSRCFVLGLLLVGCCAAPVLAEQADEPRAEVVVEQEADAASPAAANFSKFDALMTGVTVFVLAVFVGFEVISKVPTTLHTPLMSGSNAISGITVVGAIIVGAYALASFSAFLGFLAIALAMINVVGGFLVTHRMLKIGDCAAA
jgi:NAD(P) transhydrogenase subunit alpha